MILGVVDEDLKESIRQDLKTIRNGFRNAFEENLRIISRNFRGNSKRIQ